MLLNSKKVKIEGLGTFYTTLENEKGGALKKEDYSVNKHMKALHIRFLPEQTTEENISSREFIKQAEFINIDSLQGSPSAGSESGPSTGSGTAGGSGSGTTGGNPSTGSGTAGGNTGGGGGGEDHPDDD